MKRNEILKFVKEELLKVGINEPSEGEFLVALSLGISRGKTHTIDEINAKEIKIILKNLKKRKRGMPLSIIFNCANFYGRDFKVTKHCLCPRPETEELVLLVSKNVDKKLNVLDLCTGSGAIAITLNAEFGFKNIFASDISSRALSLAKTNAKRYNSDIKFVKSNLFNRLNGLKFDAIVSNPPYINEEDYNNLEVEVKNYEPKIALLAGDNGLEFYREIIEKAPNFLNENGKILFEVGYNQAKEVSKLLEKQFKDIKVFKDLEGVERMVMATIKEK